jgi:HK97 family phage portal protein
MNWFTKLFSNATLKEPEWWRQSGFARPTGSGQTVTVDSAMRVSAVYGCVRIISEAIAALPIKIYEKTDDGREVSGHYLNNLINLPNSIQTGFELREFQLSDLLLRGNSYNQKVRTNRGQLGEIIPLYSQHMNVDKTRNGKLIFDYQETGSAHVFNQDEIWRISGRSSNGVTGDSPISQAKEAIGLALALEEHGAALFKNGTQTGAVFEIPGTLEDKAFERLQKELKQKQGSSHAHENLILEGGLVRKSIAMTAEDSQFIETRKFTIADIARFYRVPLHKLNEMSAATFSNIEHQSIEFVTDTLTPWMVRIESSIYRDLLTPKEREKLYAKHSVNALLRGATKERSDFYKAGINDGWLKANEVRGYEDLNKEAGLDTFRQPLNTTTVGAKEQQMTDAAISNLVEMEVKALKQDKAKNPQHFVDFYARHLTKAANMLAINKQDLIPYGEARLKAIETGINDNLLTNISANAADEMKAIL